MTTCPTCSGKCCRDSDYRNRVYHMAAEVYEHWCDDCYDGEVPQPDPRDAQVAAMREAIHHWRCVGHERWCHVRADCPCNCGADETNAARDRARRAAGLEGA